MIKELLSREREVVESALDELLPRDAWPERLHRAMAHAVFAGGKRIRPILARMAHRAAGGDPDEITVAACGLELIQGGDAVEPETDREKRIKERNRIDPELRLACRVHPSGNLTVRAPYW